MSDDRAVGFQLRELRLCGPGRQPATLLFTDGLNVVEGASDTGKSFAVSCIDFVMAAQDAPEEIPEARGYDVAYLSIESAEGERFTLKRALVGGQVAVFRGSIDEGFEADASRWESLGVTTNAKKSVSGFLLGLCGLSNKQVRTHASGKTKEASFRDLVKALIVDEERIIAKRSPIYGSQKTGKTAAESTIRLLLTGHDDSQIVQPEDKKTAAGRLAGQKQTIEQLIQREEELLTSLTGEEAEGWDASEAAVQEMDLVLAQLSATASTALSEVRAAEKRRRAAWNALRQGRERSSELDGMLVRAHLLDEHYCSDLRRLEAMVESAHLLRHYSEEACQFCGADPEHQQHEHGQSPEATIEAATVEAAKVRRLRVELNSASAQMAGELRELNEQNDGHQAEIERVSKLIEHELSPRMQEAAEMLRAFQAEYGTHVRIREVASRLASLREQLDVLAEQPEKAEKLEFVKLTANTMSGVCRQIAGLLKRWGTSENPTVSFDEKTADVIVDGRSRTSHGKGVRAVMGAAYVIGLMQYNVQHKTGHPGFVVIDTPLNPYKAADADDKGKLSRSVKASFYQDLCSTQELGQVIVFENETPPEDVQAACNYVHFSGSAAGRRGFIPVPVERA